MPLLFGIDGHCTFPAESASFSEHGCKRGLLIRSVCQLQQTKLLKYLGKTDGQLWVVDSLLVYDSGPVESKRVDSKDEETHQLIIVRVPDVAVVGHSERDVSAGVS